MKSDNCMGRNIKSKPDHLCIAIFMLCLSVRFVEYFLIETDKTAVGENVLHKVVGIIILALVLKRINLSWSDIGFHRNGFVSGIYFYYKGLLKYVGVMLTGKMEVLTDQETKNMIWEKGDTMFYKKGVTDPD